MLIVRCSGLSPDSALLKVNPSPYLLLLSRIYTTKINNASEKAPRTPPTIAATAGPLDPFPVELDNVGSGRSGIFPIVAKFGV